MFALPETVVIDDVKYYRTLKPVYDVREKDLTAYAKAPGLSADGVLLRCVKALRLRSGDVEIAWVSNLTGVKVFEGLYQEGSLIAVYLPEESMMI